MQTLTSSLSAVIGVLTAELPAQGAVLLAESNNLDDFAIILDDGGWMPGLEVCPAFGPTLRERTGA